jgi:hypothetical protein
MLTLPSHFVTDLKKRRDCLPRGTGKIFACEDYRPRWRKTGAFTLGEAGADILSPENASAANANSHNPVRRSLLRMSGSKAALES